MIGFLVMSYIVHYALYSESSSLISLQSEWQWGVVRAIV